MSNLDFEQSVKWLTDNGGYFNPNLERKADQNGVFGIYAKGSIKADDVLCRIPNKCAITDKLHESPETWNRKLKLTYSILKEKQKGQDSFFKNTVKCMTPLEEFREYHPYFLSDVEHELLNGLSPIFQMLKNGIKQGYEGTVKEIQAHDPSFTEEEILWGCMNNNTRSWLGLYLPVMEMFNNSIRHGNINQTLEEESLVKAKTDYQIGEQVYISYGNKDMLALSYEYGFYDPSDYPLVLPLALNYTGTTPLNFAVGRMLIEQGFKGALSEDQKTIVVGIDDLGKIQRMGKLICFSREGISRDLFRIFEIFSIENYSELAERKGPYKRTLKYLSDHLTRMIGEELKIDISGSKSQVYLTMVKVLQERMKILRDCRAWIQKELEKNGGLDNTNTTTNNTTGSVVEIAQGAKMEVNGGAAVGGSAVIKNNNNGAVVGAVIGSAK